MTQVKVPSGKVHVDIFRLLARRPHRDLVAFFTGGVAGTATRSGAAVRYWPVRLSGDAMTCRACLRRRRAAVDTGAGAHIDHDSRRQRMASSSCSTTITVLPMSRRRSSVSRRRALSRWCRPMEGSSRHTAPRSGRSRFARRGGCAGSRHRTGCPTTRTEGQIFKTDVARKPSRSLISRRMRRAISDLLRVSFSSSSEPLGAPRQCRICDTRQCAAADFDRQRFRLEAVATACRRWSTV